MVTMVKLFCNRCRKEIKDQYYTIDFREYSTKPARLEKQCCASEGYSTSRAGMLALLNDQEMFCTTCKEQIENFISNVG